MRVCAYRSRYHYRPSTPLPQPGILSLANYVNVSHGVVTVHMLCVRGTCAMAVRVRHGHRGDVCTCEYPYAPMGWGGVDPSNGRVVGRGRPLLGTKSYFWNMEVRTPAPSTNLTNAPLLFIMYLGRVPKNRFSYRTPSSTKYYSTPRHTGPGTRGRWGAGWGSFLGVAPPWSWNTNLPGRVPLTRHDHGCMLGMSPPSDSTLGVAGGTQGLGCAGGIPTSGVGGGVRFPQSLPGIGVVW